jgi:EAL domain-containing protein (putative c-di-GMP-specific phosphodiesterase class I)
VPEILGAGSIKQILGQRQAVLRMQPIYDYTTGKPLQHEALLRLLDSVGNEVSPQQFLKTVVEGNLLPALDMMTLALLESQLGFPANDLETPVTVNISSRTLGHAPYLDYLASPRWAPMLDRLVLELKIGDLTQNAQNAHNLSTFKSKGIAISLNYQTGGAVITKLVAQMGFDYLKFDTKAFSLTYDDEERRDAMDAISAARAHGVKVIFERVETEHDLASIKICRPDMVQGYLFGFPQFRLTTMKTPLLSRPVSKPAPAH